MYYVFYSTTNKYQICTFNPYTFSEWSVHLHTCMRLGFSKGHNTTTNSVESRIDRFTKANGGEKTCTLVAQVETLADLPNLYPELFI